MDAFDIIGYVIGTIIFLFILFIVFTTPIKSYVAVHDGAVCNNYEKHDSCGYNLDDCTDGRVFVCVTNVELIEVS